MDSYDETLGEDTPRNRKRARAVDPEQGADIERRMAAMMVRRVCNQHRCTGSDCTDIEHRKDNDFLLSTDKDHPGMLDMLGLAHEYPDLTEQDRTVWLKWLGQAGPPEDADLEDAA